MDAWDDEDYEDRFGLLGRWIRRTGRTRRRQTLRFLAEYFVVHFNDQGWLTPIDTFRLIQTDFFFIDMIGGFQEFLVWQVHINLMTKISWPGADADEDNLELQDQAQEMALQFFRDQAAEDVEQFE